MAVLVSFCTLLLFRFAECMHAALNAAGMLYDFCSSQLSLRAPFADKILGSNVGPTIKAIIRLQFANLRDG
jgi:hypothetical protein